MTHITPIERAKARDMAAPVLDLEWGTDEQIDAENAFFEFINPLVARCDDLDKFQSWCLKATTDEMVDEALTIIGAKEDC